MAYDLKFDDEILDQIVSYIQERFHGTAAQDAAVERIERALQRLANNPITLGRSAQGPFRGMQALLPIGHSSHTAYIQVAYTFTEDEQAIKIIGFKPAAM